MCVKFVRVKFFPFQLNKNSKEQLTIYYLFYIFRGSTSGKLAFEMQSPIVGLEKVGKMLIVGCMDKSITCFTSKVIF